ncbi:MULTISPECIES: hypothetical protein [unclassified Bartonella]|uniref:hypothetical protein n=1 Tax=unclassified Bartonella TaxID=2645622 RepID=UPI0015FCEDE1|nr:MULTISPECIES: hypothetical protein [unclassified Bartonella]UXN02925.1 hypothetical protein N6B01_10675 [Bartonella sp. HY406]UXN05888.1 hypothetical protein N6A79_11405 [Bartonella sp. HY761]
MAKGLTKSIREIVTKYGLKYFDGSNNDDVLTVQKNIESKSNSAIGINLGNGDDILKVNGSIKAQGKNTITGGDGDKEINIRKGLEADKGGENRFTFGEGSHILTFGSDIEAGSGSANRIIAGEGDSIINVKGDLDSKGLNEILLGYGSHEINIEGFVAEKGGVNRLTTEGQTELNIKDSIKAKSGTNEITTGEGDDHIIIGDKLSAKNGGVNRISTGDGDDVVHIKDGAEADRSSHNYVDTGAGNDTIILDDGVNVGGLTIDAGDGYDVLVLNSNYNWSFQLDYRNWLTDLQQSGELASTNLEEIQANIGYRASVSSIDWLTQLINDYNAEAGHDDINLTVNLDSAGRVINFDSLFTSADESAITGISLTGGRANTLKIGSDIQSSGYDNDSLHITGDGNDTVQLASNWHLSESNYTAESGVIYNVYNNGANEEIFVQASMNVAYG